MGTAATIGIVLAVIAGAALATRLLTAQHAERASAFNHGWLRPGRRGSGSSTAQLPGGLPGSRAGNTRRDHRDGGRGRLRPRRRVVRRAG
jgi:hypothetical protein